MTDFVTARFRRCVAKLIDLEGRDKVANHPHDHGGLTKWGISQRSYPSLNIRLLTRDDAVQIYHRDFWTPIRGDQFVAEPVAQEVFEFAVHSGPRRAARALQVALNGLGRPLLADGRIGPATIAASNGVAGPVLLAAFKRQAEAHYQRVIAADPTQQDFAEGWANRLKEEGV